MLKNRRFIYAIIIAAVLTAGLVIGSLIIRGTDDEDFYGNEYYSDVSESKTRIINLARGAIEYYLKEGKRLEPPDNIDQKLKQERGVFVTLNKNNELRGCIGRPVPEQPLVDGIIDSAIDAAINDPRFPKVTVDELDETIVEVSVLTPPESIEVDNQENYPDEIKVGEDGLIVICDGSRGYLLPQIPVNRGWDSEKFLSRACVKAGCSSDCWLKEDIVVKKFSAQVFGEEEPGGIVIEENLA